MGGREGKGRSREQADATSTSDHYRCQKKRVDWGRLVALNVILPGRGKGPEMRTEGVWHYRQRPVSE